MARGALEIAGMCVSVIGLLGAAASTAMPMWRVTAYMGENILVMETRYEGLWMNCYSQATVRMQCEVYDSLLALPPDLRAARGLMCCSVALTGLGLFIAIAGMRCTACIQGNDRAKHTVLVVAGCMILMGCICCVVPVSWTGVIMQDFIDAQLGESLYIGWVSSALLFAGGCIFTCCTCPPDRGPGQRYVYRSNAAPYAAYQPQPVTFHLQPPSVYRHPSSSLQTPRHPSSSLQTPRHPSSFLQTPRHPSSPPSFLPRHPSAHSQAYT